MINLEQFAEINFLEIAQAYVVEENSDIYFYARSNLEINLRNEMTNDFTTWVMSYNHYEGNVSLIVAGQPPTKNVDVYTLVSHLENVTKPEPSEPISEETPAVE